VAARLGPTVHIEISTSATVLNTTRIVVAFVRGRTIYEISYTGSAPSDPDLAEHASIYEHMRQSFKRHDHHELGNRSVVPTGGDSTR